MDPNRVIFELRQNIEELLAGHVVDCMRCDNSGIVGKDKRVYLHIDSRNEEKALLGFVCADESLCKVNANMRDKLSDSAQGI